MPWHPAAITGNHARCVYVYVYVYVYVHVHVHAYVHVYVYGHVYVYVHVHVYVYVYVYVYAHGNNVRTRDFGTHQTFTPDLLFTTRSRKVHRRGKLPVGWQWVLSFEHANTTTYYVYQYDLTRFMYHHFQLPNTVMWCNHEGSFRNSMLYLSSLFQHHF